MAFGRYTDPAEDEAAIARSRQAWDRILAARSQVTRAEGQAVSAMAANYPNMSPGTVIPLARAGVAPDDPLANHVATAEAKQNKKKKGFFGALGDIVQGGLSGAMFLPEVATGIGRNVIGAGQALGDTAGRVVAGAVSGAAVGGAAGLLGGPLAPLTSTVGAIGGAVIGGGLGLAADDVETEGFVNPLRQTTLGQDLLYGQSQGTGFMPGGTAAVAQADAARRAASVSGHALTPGRFLATSVVEEGTAPYNLLSGAMDAAVAWKLDPTDIGLKHASKVKKNADRFLPSVKELKARVAARGDDIAPVVDEGDDFENFVAAEKAVDDETLRTLERQDAGLVDGTRKTIIGEKVDAWLGTKNGQRTLQWFADNDFDTIRKALGGDKVDVAVVRQLADATTVEEADALLRPLLGIAGGVATKPKVGTWGMEVKRVATELPFFEKVAQSRMWSDLPTGRINYTDPTKAVHQFDLLARDANLHLEDGVDLADASRRFADALLEGTFEGNRAADRIIYQTFGGARGKVSQSKAGRNFMDKVHARAGAQDEEVLRALIDEDATKMTSEHALVNGETQNMPAAGHLADYLDTGVSIDLKTVRGIRAATSKYSRLMDNDAIQKPTTLLEHFTNDVWKPTALLRGAWTVRVVGEEQIRMAASGRMSLFNHPISYLAWAMDDTGRITEILKKHGINVGGRGQFDITDERFAKEGSTIIPDIDAAEAELRGAGVGHFGEAVNHKQKAEAWAGTGFVEAGHRKTYHRGGPGHVKALAENIDTAFEDPLMKMLAGQPRNVVREWFTKGEGNAYRQRLIKNGAPLRSNADIDNALDNAQKQLDAIMGKVSAINPPTPARALAGGGLSADQAVAAQAARRAARPGSPTIRQAIAEGQLNGVPIRTPKGDINRDFIDELDKLGDELPDKIVGSATRQDKTYQASRDKAVQFFYTHLMTKPSAKLSRSPMFRQTYWDEAKNLATELDPKAQQKLLAAAEKSRLPKKDLDALRLRVQASSGNLTIDEADMLLKGRALDATQTLLYDAAQRGQMTDVLRIIMPFAEAQKEVMTVWAKVGVVDNPAVLNKARKVLSAARQSGMFYKDPSTGEEMFVFPGSEFLTEKTLGMPIPLTGRVQGLNTFGSSIIPGIGPAIQIPTRWLLPDKPRFDGIREMIDPFGASAAETEGVLEQQFPGWLTAARRALQSSDSDRGFANAVKDTWAQGVSAGRYSTETPEDIRNGLDHAKSTARWLFTIKSMSMMLGAPTPPSPKFMAMDKDGKWHMAKALSEDYRKMMDDPEIGFEGASAAFIEKYGNNAAVFMQAKTYATTAAAPSDVDFAEWARGDGAPLAKKYSETYALFGPQGEGFDYSQHLRNIRSGATKSLSPKEFAEQTNNRQGQMIYHNFKDRFGPTPSKEQREWLATLRVKLREQYPGYDVTLPGKPDAKVIKQQYIPEIQRAVEDPALADNDVAKLTRAYLTVRAQAEKAAEAAGYANFDQAKGAAPLRSWLRQVLDRLVAQTPDFAPMAERIFDREMKDDGLDDATEALPAMPA